MYVCLLHFCLEKFKEKQRIKGLTTVCSEFNTLPNGKILDLSELKTFAGDNFNVNQKLKFGMERVENIVGKGENAGYQHFLHFPQCFQTAPYTGSLRVVILW